MTVCPNFGQRGGTEGKFQVEVSLQTWPTKGDMSEIAAKFSLSSRGCLQGVKRGDNGNRDGPTDRERQPRGASPACHLSSQTPPRHAALPEGIFKIAVLKMGLLRCLGGCGGDFT